MPAPVEVCLFREHDAVRPRPHDTEGTTMKTFAFATLAASGLAAATLGLATLGLAAPAVAAPSGTGSAQDTVNKFEASGYKVILNKVGGAPLDQCTVTAVRPGRQITQPVTAGSGDLTNKVLYTTVFVDANC
jgi:hypothetical protein